MRARLEQVLLDGRIVGGVPGDAHTLAAFVARLRLIKSDPTDKRIPETTEIVYVADTAGPYPGIFIHTCAARMVRQCRLRYNNQLEWVSATCRHRVASCFPGVWWWWCMVVLFAECAIELRRIGCEPS